MVITICILNYIISVIDDNVLKWDKWDDLYDGDYSTREVRRPQGTNNHTPRNNRRQNRDFWEAMRRVGELLGNPVTSEMARRVHDEISGQGLSIEEIVEWAMSMFGE